MNTSTVTRRQPFDFHHLESNEFAIKEIAHSLSTLSRFTGRSREFYSVAQHCVLVSHSVPQRFALQGLMHDTPKAYLGVVSGSLKPLLPDFAKFERAVRLAIFSRFGLPHEIDPQVRWATLIVGVTEHRDLFETNEVSPERLPKIQPLDKKITPWFPSEAKRHFLTRFKELYKPDSNDIEDFARVSHY